MEPQAISPDIPVTKAWRSGRRVYVRAGYRSLLDQQIRELGGRWDPEHKALWVGSGKLERVAPLVLTSFERAAAVQAIKDAGRWVRIPPAATEIRAEAKRLGGVWDGDRKAWAMPSGEALTATEALVKEYARAERDRERETADERRGRIIAASGRTATGEVVTTTRVSTHRMNKSTALRQARQEGDVLLLTDGRRGLVTQVDVWFTGDELASSTCWHPETHDQAHWDTRYTLAIIEPTSDERAADKSRAAEVADAQQIAETVAAVRSAIRSQAVSDLHQVAGGSVTIKGPQGTAHDGTLVLTPAGAVVWQHPGYYDDYRRTEGQTADPEIAGALRQVLAAGARTRHHDGRTYIVATA